MPTIILGLDIGTTSVSGVAIDETSRTKTAVSTAHHAAVPNLPDGYAEQDPDCLLSAAIDVLHRLAETVDPADVKAISLTGQMHSTVLLDMHQAPIGNVITWQDKRAVATAIDSGSGTLFEQLHERCSDAALRKSGCRLSPGFLGTTVFALRRLRQWPTNCRSVSFVAGWIARELTGEAVVTDPSHAASSGLVDLTINRWNADLLAAAEVNPDWLPRVQPSGRPVGRLTEAMAERTGLRAGTLVGNAVGDNQAAVLSALPDEPGSVLINIGTGGQIVWRVPEFVRVERMETRYLPMISPNDDARFMLVGAGLVGGNSLAWLNQTLRQWLAAFGVQRSEAEIWEALQQQMDQTTGAKGLTCEPFFSGTRPEPDRRGTFRGISGSNFTPSGVAVAILNGIADSMYDVYQRAGEYAPRPLRRVVMAGNASRSNPRLVSAVAERFQVSVSVADFPEEAATGAAILTAARLGHRNFQ